MDQNTKIFSFPKFKLHNGNCLSHKQGVFSPKPGELCYNKLMRIVSRRCLVEFWKIHPDAEQPLRAWFTEAKKANWKSPSEVKMIYRNVSILPNNRVVFNIKGNTYRLVVIVEYSQNKMFIRFVGTHAEYDRINASLI